MGISASCHINKFLLFNKWTSASIKVEITIFAEWSGYAQSNPIYSELIYQVYLAIMQIPGLGDLL